MFSKNQNSYLARRINQTNRKIPVLKKYSFFRCLPIFCVSCPARKHFFIFLRKSYLGRTANTKREVFMKNTGFPDRCPVQICLFQKTNFLKHQQRTYILITVFQVFLHFHWVLLFSPLAVRPKSIFVFFVRITSRPDT